jgi:hypothetical protein
VRRQDLDVFVAFQSIHLVLEPEVGEMDLVVEVRQVVVVRPLLDLPGVAVRTAIAVRPVAVVLLQELLVLPFELLLEHHTPDLGALLAQPFLGSQVRPIELGVVIELPRPVHARVKLLMAFLVAVAAVRFEQVSPAVGEDQSALLAVQGDRPNQAVLDEMVQAVVARIELVVTRVTKITLRDDPERADRRERSAVLAIQLVGAIAVQDQLPFAATREIEIM